jgi:hypothetical protein
LDRYLAITWSAVLHGIHSIHRKIQDDLLQVNRIGAYGQGAVRLVGIERDAAFQCLRAKNLERIANSLIEIEFLQFDLISLLQQTAQVSDDVCRALIVAPYVGEDPFGPLDVGRVCLEIERRPPA